MLILVCFVVGIQNRASHLHIPEPEVAHLFRSSSSTSSSKKTKKGAASAPTSDVDIDAIEKRLKRAKREKPKSVEIYNQIANYWRIKGDTQVRTGLQPIRSEI
jgi:hypothetical protein